MFSISLFSLTTNKNKIKVLSSGTIKDTTLIYHHPNQIPLVQKFILKHNLDDEYEDTIVLFNSYQAKNNYIPHQVVWLEPVKGSEKDP